MTTADIPEDIPEDTPEANVVTSKAQMVAALRAAAHPTFEQARKDPVTIRWGTTLFKFKEGIHTTRAEEIIKNILRREL
jgi:hypothetical protein